MLDWFNPRKHPFGVPIASMVLSVLLWLFTDVDKSLLALFFFWCHFDLGSPPPYVHAF